MDGSILFVGSFDWPIYDEAMSASLESLGCGVQRFSWRLCFQSAWPAGGRLQRRLLAGPAMRRLQHDLIDRACRLRPAAVLIQRGTPIQARTVGILRRGGACTVVALNQDDPLAPQGSGLEWRHFRRSIPIYDLHFVCRRVNLAEFAARGARRVHLLRQHYVAELHHPPRLSSGDIGRWGCDVTFIGHYEADGRLAMLDRLLADGVDVRVRGTGWNRRALADTRCAEQLPIGPVYGRQYVKALAAAKICLCFFSRLNRDEVTTRSFEIPAVGGFLLCQRTEAMLEVFAEGREAEYFSSCDELAQKVQYYLRHDEQRQRIAAAGRRRLLQDGHDVRSRMRVVLQHLREFRAEHAAGRRRSVADPGPCSGRGLRRATATTEVTVSTLHDSRGGGASR